MVSDARRAIRVAASHHGGGRSIPTRRRLLLRNFDRTRLDGGLWGLHAHSQPYLFVTTPRLRCLKTARGPNGDDPLIEPARRFLQAEGVTGIPSWGKFWLALLNLYDWRGVNAILPELWRLPRWTAIHPSKWYCHTRLIYMAMAANLPAPVPDTRHAADRVVARGAVSPGLRQRRLRREPQSPARRGPLRAARCMA